MLEFWNNFGKIEFVFTDLSHSIETLIEEELVRVWSFQLLFNMLADYKDSFEEDGDVSLEKLQIESILNMFY